MIARWSLPIFAFLVMVAFWPGWEGGAIAPRWELLAIGGPIFLLATRIEMTPVHWLGIALLAWCALTLQWTPAIVLGIGELARVFILIAIFCVAAEVEDMRRTYIAIGIGVSISGLLAAAQVFGFEFVPQSAPPAGLFANRNFLGEIGAVALILALGMRLWWLTPGPVLAIVCTHSRGVFLALLTVALLWCLRRSVWWAVGLVIVACALAFAVLSIPEIPTFLVERISMMQRVGVWQATLEHMAWAGHGIGSFMVDYPSYMPHPILTQARPAHPHNELLYVASELGFPGLFLFTAILVLCLSGGAETERLVLVAILAIGMFSFPLHLPATGFVAALVAGRLARMRYPVCSDERVVGAIERRRLA